MKKFSSMACVLCLTVLAGLVSTARVIADGKHAQASPARLVQLVREATRPFLDVRNAALAFYVPKTGCVSGPSSGAMGVHHINEELLKDGELDVARPEALLYETARGRVRLLGVEYIVDAKKWLEQHGAPPVLEGQHFHFVDTPNRYGLDPFFELHVWAWRGNPDGAFVDWNTEVTCEGQ